MMATLPPKSRKEENKHLREYLSMMKHAESKEQSLQQKEQKYKQKHESDMLASLKIWHTQILPNWDSVRYSKKTIELWSKGIPPRLRGTVWAKAAGNSLKLTPGNIDMFFDIFD
ncbi:hypothetical protein HMI55_000926 [Coelomomyces lativittatus]|nr:hypothetical protein HMI55_000926 [Coelomomyces lativittatus]